MTTVMHYKVDTFVVRLDEGGGKQTYDEIVEWLDEHEIEYDSYFHSDGVEVIFVLKDDVRAVEFKLRWC